MTNLRPGDGRNVATDQRGESREACRWCRFFMATRAALPADGWCLRYPPSPAMSADQAVSRVGEDFWCGEFRRSAEAEW